MGAPEGRTGLPPHRSLPRTGRGRNPAPPDPPGPRSGPGVHVARRRPRRKGLEKSEGLHGQGPGAPKHPHGHHARRPLTSDAIATRDPGFRSRSASTQPIRDPLRAAPPTADGQAPTLSAPGPVCRSLASDWPEPAVGGTGRSRPDGARGRGSEAG